MNPKADAVKLPPIVFGATSLGNLFRSIPDPDKAKIVAAWVRSGVSPLVIDSAGKYGAGLSLEVIGRELHRLGVSPSDVIISNKLAWRRVPLTSSQPTFEPGAWVDIQHDAVQDISYDGILRCWREGNELLGHYAATMVSVHDPDEYLAAARDAADRNRRLDDIVQAYRALCELKNDGQVASTGVGAKDWRTIEELDQYCEFDWVMFANSLTVVQHPPELLRFIDRLAQRGIAVINSALFHGGFLLGGNFFDYRPLDKTDAMDCQKLEWREAFHRICAEHALRPFDVGVAFGRSHPGVRAVALSSSRADRVADHVLAAQRTIPTEFWQVLKRSGLIATNYPYV